MSNVTARVATLEDVDGILEMMEDFNVLELIPWNKQTGRAPLRHLISTPVVGMVGVFLEDETVVGYCVITWGFDLEWAGRDAFMTEFYLRASVRGRGLGRICIAAVDRFARTNGARALHLLVRHENEAALRLYRSAGFSSPGRAFMTKPLPPESGV